MRHTWPKANEPHGNRPPASPHTREMAGKLAGAPVGRAAPHRAWAPHLQVSPVGAKAQDYRGPGAQILQGRIGVSWVTDTLLYWNPTV